MAKTEIIAPGQSPEQEWADRINQQWDNIRETAVQGYIQLGRDLIQVRKQFGGWGSGFKKWGEWCEAKLNFGYQVANILVGIADWVDEKQIYSSAIKLLPPNYTTIRAITRLDELTFKRLIKDGTIRPTLSRNEIAAVLRQQKTKKDERRVLDLKPKPGKFRTLIFDPAWDYKGQSTAGRAQGGYATQTLEQLRELDVMQWVDEACHLYCWVTNNFMAEACKLVEHWGFQHRTLITWVKPSFGIGSYFRNSTEHVLFATFGDLGTRPKAASIPTHFEAPRGEHSSKPDQFYEIVKAASFPPYGEANQRTARADFVDLFEVRKKSK